MALDKKDKKEIVKITNSAVVGTLSKMLGTDKAETTAVPRSPVGPKSVITPHLSPNVPVPPEPTEQSTTGRRKRRNKMAIKGELLFWRDTVIEIFGVFLGAVLVISLLIGIIKWAIWLWGIF